MPVHTATAHAPSWEWAARNMPLLRRSAIDVGDGLAGRTIGVCLHLEPKTAVLLDYLSRAGARVIATGSPGTSDPAVLEDLRRIGVTVHASHAETEDDHRRHVHEIIAAAPDLVLDNGADLIWEIQRTGVSVVGATEETTTGASRIRGLERQVDFPVVVINDSRLKLVVENEYGVGQTVVQGFMNATNLMLPGLAATIVGFGPCGRGVATTLGRLGARVTVVEPDPFRALEAAMLGYRVATMDTALSGARALFVAAGAAGAVPADAVAGMADGAVIAGVSHFPDDIDLEALRRQASASRRFATRTAELEMLRLAHGEVVIVNDLHMVNLSAARGNPIEAMDLGLALQLRSLAWLATHQGARPGPQQVPYEIDRWAAQSMVDMLTAEVQTA